MKEMKRRFLAALLSFLLVFGMCGMDFAEREVQAQETEITEAEIQDDATTNEEKKRNRVSGKNGSN